MRTDLKNLLKIGKFFSCSQSVSIDFFLLRLYYIFEAVEQVYFRVV